MIRRSLHLAVVLGLITAVGPFAVDMYLPALPSMGASLNAEPAEVQMSLTVFLITMGVMQLVYGPLSDMIGRKRPIYAGLAIFTVGSIGCALSPDIQVLIGFRIVQAIGACAGMVITRAIVRDMHTGHQAARLMSMLMLVASVSPILAPVTGSLVIATFGWRGVFWVLTGGAVVALALAMTQFSETHTAERRSGRSWRGLLAAYRRLLLDPVFMGLTLLSSFGFGAFFIYLGGGAFVFINHYGLTATQFSLCFSVNAVSFFGFGQLTAPLTKRYGLARVVLFAAAGFAAAMTTLATLVLLGFDGLGPMIVLPFIGYGFLGLIVPSAAVLSLEPLGAIAGTASALLGSLQLGVGAMAIAVSALVSDGTPKPMTIGIAVCAVTAFSIAGLTLWTRRETHSSHR